MNTSILGSARTIELRGPIECDIWFKKKKAKKKNALKGELNGGRRWTQPQGTASRVLSLLIFFFFKNFIKFNRCCRQGHIKSLYLLECVQ